MAKIKRMKLAEQELAQEDETVVAEDGNQAVEDSESPAGEVTSPPEDPTPLSARISGDLSPDDELDKKLKAYKNECVAPAVFFKFLRSIPREREDIWNQIILYVYRLEPVINRKQVNPDNPINIGVFSEAITEQMLVDMYGYGKYKLTLNYLPRTQHRQAMWCVFKPNVSISEAPPKLDYRELQVNNRENRNYVQYLQQKGILNNEGNVVEQNNGRAVPSGVDPVLLQFMERQQQLLLSTLRAQKPTNDTEAQAISKAIDIVAQGGTKANELMMAQIRQADPSNTIELVKTLLATMRPPDNSDFMKFIIASMEQTKQENQLLLKAMLDKKTEDPADSFLKWQEVFKGMGHGGGGGEEMSWKESLLAKLPDVLANVTGIIAMAMQRGKAPVSVQAQPAQQAQPGAVGELQPPQPDQNEAIKQQLAQYGPLIVKAINRGEDGGNFASSIETMFGIESGVYPAIASLGKEGILAALQSEPGTWAALAPMQPKVELFIEQFLDYQNEQHDDGEDKQ